MKRLSGTESLFSFAPILCVILASYFPLLGQPTFSPDAHVIIPPLMHVNLGDYLRLLVSFEVVDFQPVRDLTFLIDIFFFKNFQLNTFAVTNVLLWALACFSLSRLARRTLPQCDRLPILLGVCAFAAYPLFSQAVGWTMARKHVLAFALILQATEFFFDWREGKRSWIFAYLLYAAAALSHPIVIFWPVWALLQHCLLERRLEKKDLPVYGSFFTTMVLLLLTNYYYYVILSPRVLEYYGHVRPSFSFSETLLRLGFYFQKLFSPFELAFVYYPRLSNSWFGFLLIPALGWFSWINRQKRQVLSWVFFSLTPFPVIMGLSIYDQYLLLTGAGLFLALTPWISQLRRPTLLLGLLALVLFSVNTLIQARKWTSEDAISLRNFHSEPSCRSAIEAMNRQSQVSPELSEELLDYYARDNCFTVYQRLPPLEKPKAIAAFALFLFHSRGKLPEEKVLSELQQLGKLHYYPFLLYAVLLARRGDVQGVKQSTDFVEQKISGSLEDLGPVVLKNLGPFCREHQIRSCEKLLTPSTLEAFPFL